MRLCHNISNRQYALDIDVHVRQIIRSIKVKVSVEVLIKETNNRIHITNQTVDMCTFMSQGPKNWQMKVLIGGFNRFSNLPKSCPIMPGNYSVKNFTTDIKHIPMRIIPEAQTFAVFQVISVVNKRISNLANVKVDAEVKYNEL